MLLDGEKGKNLVTITTKKSTMNYGMNWKKDCKPHPGETSLFGDPATFHKGLYQLNENVWAWMQPNGSWGESNAGVISSKGETLVWDSLYDLRLTGTFLKEIELWRDV